MSPGEQVGAEVARVLVERAIASGAHPALSGIVDPTFDWVGVNGPRVDARVRSRDGREWHVVLTVDPAGTVGEVVAFRRPDPVVPIEGVLVVANGPSGAGKSALITALAGAQPDVPWVVFEEPIVGTAAWPFLIWPDAAPVLHQGFLAGIAAVAAAGNRVGTAAAGHPQPRFRHAASAAGVRLLSVGLHAPLEVLLAREAGREGRWGGLAASSIGAHEGWTYDLELDSTAADPTALAQQVIALL